MASHAKLFRSLFICLSLVCSALPAARAQSEPVAIPLKIRVTATIPAPEASTVSLNLDGAAYYVDKTLENNKLKNPYLHLPLELGKTHTVTVSATSGAAISKVFFSAPPGYTYYVNGYERKSLSVGNGSVFKLRVLPWLDSVAATAGTASAFEPGQVKWGVSLGGDINGNSAGWLWLVGGAADLAAGSWSEFDEPDRLHLDDLHENIFVRKIDGKKRQIGTREALVDIITPGANGAKFELRFYHWETVTGGFVKTFSGLRTFTAQPYVTYRVYRDQPGHERLRIEKLVRSPGSATDMAAPVLRTEWTTVERHGYASADTYTWLATPWTQAGVTPPVRTRMIWSPTADGHSALVEQQRLVGSAYVTDHSMRQNYASPGLGIPRLPVEVVSAPGDPGLEHANHIYYHGDSSQRGSFGFPRIQRDAGGAWAYNEYYEPAANDNDADKKHGVVIRTVQPWLDAALVADPATTEDDSPLPAARLETRFEYDEDQFQMLTRPKLVESVHRNASGQEVILSRSNIAYTAKAANSRPVVLATRTDTAGQSGQTIVSDRAYYREDDGLLLLRNQLYSETSPTGERLSYYRNSGVLVIAGTEENPAVTFTENGSGLQNCVRIIAGFANPVPDGTLITTYGGRNTEDLYVVPGLSSMTSFYRDQYARLVLKETALWNGSAWVRSAWESYHYNLNHQLVRTRNSSGDVHEITYAGELKVQECDASGAWTHYQYDAANRLIRSTRQHLAPRPDLVTEYTYDAAGRITEQRTFAAGGSEQLVTTRSYDAAGRLATEQAPGSGPVSYAYSPQDRTRTTNLPDGTYTIETAYLDGQAKNVTGTGTVAAYHTYGFETNGRRWSRTHVATTNSARWSRSWIDGLGRPVRSERPGVSGQPNFVETQHYENTTGRLLRSERTGLAPTLVGYDAYGRQNLSALDLNQNGQIDLAGPDRVSGSEENLVFEEGAWWAVRRDFAYLGADSAAETTLGSTRQRLSGFTGTLRQETRSTDAEGNLSLAYARLDRATRTATTERHAPGLAAPATSLAVDGLAVSSTSPDGLVTTTTYDALLRPSSATDPRTGTYSSTYYPGTTLVHTRIDARGVTTATHVYDVLGRPISTTGADGKSSRVSYHTLGGISRRWGDTATPVSYTYDAYGQRVSQRTYRAGSAWNAASWPAATTGTADITTWTYDTATGLLRKKTDATGSYVEYAYNVRGQPTHRYWSRTVDGTPGGARVTATYAYDPLTADPVSTSYNDGTPGTSLTYDRSGRPLTRADAAGTRNYAYDPARPWRYTGETLPAYFGHRTLTPQYAENTTPAAGAWGPHTRSTVKGAQIGYALGTSADAARDLRLLYHTADTGRLAGLQVFGPAASATPSADFHYTYTAQSRLVAGLHAPAAASGYSLTRAYEPQRDLLTSIQTSFAGSARVRYEYAYDDLARRTRSVQGGDTFEDDYGDSLRTDYTYDDRGQLTAADAYLGQNPQDTSRPLPGRRHAYAYDTVGNRTTSTHHSPDPAKTAAYRTNALNQYTDRDHTGVPYRGLARADATVAVDGQLAARQERYFWRDVNFAADPQGRVFPLAAALAGQGSGGKDAVRLDFRHAFWPGDTETFAYDPDGNLLSDALWLYAYDAENRLIRMERKSWTALPGAPPLQKLEFTYDHQGRRIGKKVFTLVSGTTGWQLQKELRFIYDGWNLIAELDATQSSLPLLRSYAWGLDLVGSLTASGGVGALVQIHDHVNGARHLPAYDGNGNLAALFDAQTAALAAAYEYTPYGESIRAGGTAAIAQENPFRFSTKYTDTETGLIYYGMRFYDAKNGRFINRDPIEERGGLNLYGFCGNDGINHYDVLGMSWLSKAWKKVKKWMGKHQWVGIAIGAVAGFFTGGATWAAMGGSTAITIGAKIAIGAAAGAAGGFVGGATTTALMGGNFGQVMTGGLWGALGGAVAGGIGGYFGPLSETGRAFSWAHEAKRALAHGLSQGAIGSARGQKFGSSFLSGLAGSFGGSAFGHYFPGAPWYVGIPVTGAIGGFGSRLSGGQFEDGFASAAAISAFNHYQHLSEWRRISREKWFMDIKAMDTNDLRDRGRALAEFYGQRAEGGDVSMSEEHFYTIALRDWDINKARLAGMTIPTDRISADGTFFAAPFQGAAVSVYTSSGRHLFTHMGSDINYYIQGFAHRAAGRDPDHAARIIGLEVRAWNAGQWIKRGASSRDIQQITPGMTWAKWGYTLADIYEH